MSDPKEKVEAGYDHIAEQYLATKALDAATAEALTALTDGLADGAPVLDLGCGAGVPVTQWLAKRFTVTGVDVSAVQLDLARARVPTARLINADMADLDFPAGSFDAVAAFFSIIHVPREQHAVLVGRIHRWLRPGGRFLAPWAISAWEGGDANWEQWGAPMWWSHHDADTNLKMLEASGFVIESAARRTDGEETWLWVLARR